MEPDGHDEEMPEPTGVTINLNPDRVIAALQRRSATLVQNLQWELATRDAVVEVLEERLNESEQLREEAEGVLSASSKNELDYARELAEARTQIAKLTKGQQDLLHEREDLIKQQVKGLEGLSPQGEALRDAFLEAETLTAQPGPAAEPSPEET